MGGGGGGAGVLLTLGRHAFPFSQSPLWKCPLPAVCPFACIVTYMHTRATILGDELAQNGRGTPSRYSHGGLAMQRPLNPPPPCCQSGGCFNYYRCVNCLDREM